MDLKKKPTGIYFLEYEGPDEDGAVGRRRISLGTRDLVEAREQKRQWLTGTHPKQRRSAPAKSNPLVKTTVSEVKGWTVRKALNKCCNTVWRDAKAWTSIFSNVKIVNSYVGDELVADMSMSRIERLIEQMRDEGYAPGTIKRKLDVLSKAVSMSSAWEDPATGKPYITGKPRWPTLKVNNEKDRELSAVEEEAVYACIDERIRKDPQKPWWRFRALITTLLATGLRLSEALAMDDEHLSVVPVMDPQSGLVADVTFHGVRKEEAKNGRPRQVPLNEEVMALAPLLSMQSGGGKWFPFKPGGAWQLWDYIRKDMQARNMDIDDVVLHTLRHTCASRLRRRGVAIDIIQRWLGHSDISITVKRYVHTSAADLAAAAGFASNGSKAANHSTESSNGALRVPTFTENKRDKAGMAHLQ